MTNKPEMKSVESKMVDAIGYDDVHSTLWVTFKGGKTYTYDGVEPDRWAALWGSAQLGESVGKLINSQIKPNYPATKVES